MIKEQAAIGFGQEESQLKSKYLLGNQMTKNYQSLSQGFDSPLKAAIGIKEKTLDII